MKVLTFAAIKGGSGKTTLAMNLAVAAAADGLRVAMIDMDPQLNLRGWWNKREATDIAMPDVDPSPAELLATLPQMAGQFDLCVIDTPGAYADWIGQLYGAADLVVCPVKPSAFDLDALGPTLGQIREAGGEALMVISQVSGTVIANMVRSEIGLHGRVAPGAITHKVIHTTATFTGQGVTELGDARSAKEIAALWSSVKGLIDG